MKKLIINNTIAVIDDNQKFYFQHKVNNLDDYSIINLPVSKTIQIPRCQQNDEIFGYIGEIQRLTFNTGVGEEYDYKSAISFNQTKKVGYEFYDGSELISNGNLIIDNITEENYEVTLYDSLINTLEELSGDEDGNGYLNSLDIYKAGTNDKIEFPVNIDNIIDLNYIDKNLKYTINIQDDELNNNKYRCFDFESNSIKTFELSEDLTQLQANVVKSYDIEYVVPINGVIESINKKYNNIITIDSNLTNYFNELHLYCGKAKQYNKETIETKLLGLANLTKTNNTIPVFNNNIISRMDSGSPIYYFPLKDLNDNYITKVNGKYFLEIPITINFTLNGSTDEYLTNRYCHYNGVNYDMSNQNLLINQTVGELFISSEICKYIGGVTENIGTDDVLNTSKVITKILSKPGINTTFVKNDNYNNYDVFINHTLFLEYDFNPLLKLSTSECAIKIDLTNQLFKGQNYFYAYKLTNDIFLSNVFYIGIDINSGNLIQTQSDKIENGDIINGKNIYPKIPIKDLLINLSKYHNLNLKIINNKINISKKLYVDQNDIINIANINSINPKLFGFSKLQISYELPDNDLINKTYFEVNKQKYGQKNIDLNYSIKKSIKKVEYSVAIPALMTDTSNLGYDSFLNYYGGGRSRFNYGVTNGFDEKLVFCFLNKISTSIDIADDTYYELGCKSSYESGIPTEKNIVKTNKMVTYKDGDFLNTYFPSLVNTNAITAYEYYTVSPYKFNGTNISKSLEINKPKYNYAGLNDIQYPETVTHYNKYLKNYVEEIYNVNNHILECDILLDSQVDINKIYHYHNVDYVINEIPEYDPTNNYIKGVKLLKVNNKDNYLYPYSKEEGNITINSYSSITKTGMTVNERINYTGGDTIITGGVKYSTNPNNLNLTKTINNPATTFSVTLTGLTKNTLYYIQPFMISATGIYTYGAIYQQRTLDDYSVPSLTMSNTSTITYTSVIGSGSITSAGGYPVTEYGFVYSTSQFPTTSNSKKVIGFGTYFGNYSGNITSLLDNTTYYIRAYAINSNGTGYSQNQISFKTNAYSIPMLDTIDVYNVRQRDGYSGGFHLINGGKPILDKGVVLNTVGSSTPTISTYDFKISKGSGNDDFISYFSGLAPGEAYQIRSYATNLVGTGYGPLLYFSTIPIALATVTVQDYFYNITSDGGNVNCTLVYDGGSVNEIDEYGLIYSKTNRNPIDGGSDCTTVYHSSEILSTGDGFEMELTGLDANTTYYYRAFVFNEIGIAYSNTYLLLTRPNVPTITNQSLSRLANYDTELYLRFNIEGGYEVFVYGVIYSTVYPVPSFTNSEYTTFRAMPGDQESVSVTFESEAFSSYTIGSYYCRMFVLTSIGYIYSNVVMDTYGI